MIISVVWTLPQPARLLTIPNLKVCDCGADAVYKPHVPLAYIALIGYDKIVQ